MNRFTFKVLSMLGGALFGFILWLVVFGVCFFLAWDIPRGNDLDIVFTFLRVFVFFGALMGLFIKDQ